MITAKKVVEQNGHTYEILVHDWTFATFYRDGEFIPQGLHGVRPGGWSADEKKMVEQAIEEANERRDEIQDTGPQWVQL